MSQAATSRLPVIEARCNGVIKLSSSVTLGGSELLEKITVTLVTSLLRIASFSSFFQMSFCAARGVKHHKQKHRITNHPHQQQNRIPFDTGRFLRISG